MRRRNQAEEGRSLTSAEGGEEWAQACYQERIVTMMPRGGVGKDEPATGLREAPQEENGERKRRTSHSKSSGTKTTISRQDDTGDEPDEGVKIERGQRDSERRPRDTIPQGTGTTEDRDWKTAEEEDQGRGQDDHEEAYRIGVLPMLSFGSAASTWQAVAGCGLAMEKPRPQQPLSERSHTQDLGLDVFSSNYYRNIWF